MIRRPLTLVLFVVLVPCCQPLAAHDLVSGVGTQSFLGFTEGRISIKLNFGVATNRGGHYLEIIDADSDGRVTQKEREAWLETMGEKLAAELDVRANGRRLQFEIAEHLGIGIMGRVMNVQFDTFFTLVADLPGQIEGGGWWLHFDDQTCTDEESSQFICPLYGDPGDETQISYIIFEPDVKLYVEELEWHKIPGRKAVLFVNDELRWLPGQVEVPSVESLASIELHEAPEQSSDSADPVNGNGNDTQAPATRPERQPVTVDPDAGNARTDVSATPFLTRTHLWVGVAVVIIGGILGLLMRKKS